MRADFLGRCVKAPEPLEITRDTIRTFADSIGDDLALYHEVAAARATGYPALIAPPTLLSVVVSRVYWLVLTDPGFDSDPEGILHAGERLVSARPVRAGDSLLTTSKARSVNTVAGRDRVVFLSTVRDAEARYVADVTTTLLKEPG